MSQWVKTECAFGDHCRILTINYYKSSVSRAITDGLKRAEAEGPVALESTLTAMIVRARPELAGCVILSMQLNHGRWKWEILVSHGSFAQNQFGGEVPSEELFSER